MRLKQFNIRRPYVWLYFDAFRQQQHELAAKEHKEGKGDLACLTLNLLSNSSRFIIHTGLFSTNIQINSRDHVGTIHAGIPLLERANEASGMDQET